MWTVISTFLKPFQGYIALAGIAAVAIMIAVFAHHERDIQLAKDAAKDAKAVVVEHKQTVQAETNAQTQLDPSNAVLHVALDAPGPQPTFAIRVCPNDSSRGGHTGLPPNGGAVSGSDSGAGAVSGTMAGLPAQSGVDIEPTAERLLRQADAEIAYWHKYYDDCIHEGACKVAEGYHAD